MRYLVDSDVLIQAKNFHYGFDFCPGFWSWLQAGNQAGTVFSVQKIGEELRAGNDELASWAKAQGSGFFLPPDDKTVSVLPTVATWAAAQAYAHGAKARFLESGDYYLISHALAYGYTVVTHEVPAPGAVRRIKIPDACAGVGVACMNPFEMLRAEKALFISGPPVATAVAAMAAVPAAPAITPAPPSPTK